MGAKHAVTIRDLGVERTLRHVVCDFRAHEPNVGYPSAVKFLRQILVFVLALSLSPGMSELLENLEHILHDGHLAHAALHDEDEAHDALEAEHGCTPMSHSCGCHISVPIILVDEMHSEPPRWAFLASTFNPTRLIGPLKRANAPPVPPPTA